MFDAVQGDKVYMGFQLQFVTVYGAAIGAYLPTGWREAPGSEHGQSRRNEGLRGLTKADSVAA